jgi:excisionase family DNA binding protein
MKNRNQELTFNQAAEVLGCSPRHVRRLFIRNGIKPIRRGYRTVRIPSIVVVKLKLQLIHP